jgi:hypothetical protein
MSLRHQKDNQIIIHSNWSFVSSINPTTCNPQSTNISLPSLWPTGHQRSLVHPMWISTRSRSMKIDVNISMSLTRLNFDVKNLWTSENQALPLQMDFEVDPDGHFFPQKLWRTYSRSGLLRRISSVEGMILRVIESLCSDLSFVLLHLIMDSRKNINASPSARSKQDYKASERMIHITGIMECIRVGEGEGSQSVMAHIHSGERKTEILISSYRVISPISGS